MMDDGEEERGVESVSVLLLFIDSQPIRIHTSDTTDNSNDKYIKYSSRSSRYTILSRKGVLIYSHDEYKDFGADIFYKQGR